MASAVTEALGGCGVFGVEFFVKGDTVFFSEVSPRPHDTGLVTLISQNLSEFALHNPSLLGQIIKGSGKKVALKLPAEITEIKLIEMGKYKLKYIVERPSARRQIGRASCRERV